MLPNKPPEGAAPPNSGFPVAAGVDEEPVVPLAPPKRPPAGVDPVALPNRDGVLVPVAPAAGVDAGGAGFAPKSPPAPVAPPPKRPPPAAPVPVVPDVVLEDVFPNRFVPVVPPPPNSPPVVETVAGVVVVFAVPNSPPPGAGVVEDVEVAPNIFDPAAGVVEAGALEPNADPPSAGVVVFV